MRLTLRTLLAYMDDILDPSDHEELGHKIEASDFATELIHRTRDTVRRLRLGAPAVEAGENDEVLGGDPHLDANAVAEYLDNTMSPENVAEFERCCLEPGNVADMRLAEAASCHHILTMVLGEPADVRPDVRERMYGLPAQATSAAAPSGEKLRIEPAHADGAVSADGASAASGTAAAPPVAQVILADADAEVPDYLRAAARQEQQGRIWKTIGIAAMLLIGAGIGYLAWPTGEVDLSSVDPENREAANTDLEIGELAPTGDPNSATASTGDTGDGGEAPQFDPSTATEEAPKFVPGVPDAPPTETPAVETTPDAQAPVETLPPVESSPPQADDDEDATPDETTAIAAAPNYREGADEVEMAVDDQGNIRFGAEELGGIDEFLPESAPTTTANSIEPGAASDAGAVNDITGAVMAALPEGVDPEDDAADDDAADDDAADDDAVETTTDEAPPAEPAEPAGPVAVGSYPGNDDLLLIYRPESQSWVRMPDGVELRTGDQLLTLPMFRTNVELAGVHVSLIDGAEIKVAPLESRRDVDSTSSDGASDLRLELLYGRLLLTAGLESRQVELTIGDQVWVLKLGASTTLAVQVERRFVPGAQADLGPLEVTWHLTSGTVESVVGGGESIDGGEVVEAPATWQTVDDVDSAAEGFDDLPDWVEPPRLTQLDKVAIEDVSDALEAGQPVVISLLELSDKRGLGRKREVRSLAAQSGAYVGVFEPFVRALNDESLPQNVRAMQIETVREALARDPQAADQLHADFAAQRGEDAAEDLMEMLLGYDAEAIGITAAERKEGALPKLIRWLDSDQLDYRVLASYNLNNITGKSGLGNYLPRHTAQQRQRALRIYWDRLEKDELRPR